jgi:ATP-dependent exoDNAse (exonuclease V) beta subunit
MRRAAEALAKGRAWRESYVSAPVGDSGLILEGYVDLVFEDDEGALVIVDYKTDRTTNAAKAYELQLGAYVAAVRKATGLAVSEAVLVFSQQASEALKNGSSLEDAQHSVSDLDQAAELAIKLAEERSAAG